MNWTEMKPIEFDSTLAPPKRDRGVGHTIAAVLFPELLPEPKPPPPIAACPCGTADMLGLLSTGETTGKD